LGDVKSLNRQLEKSLFKKGKTNEQA